MYRSSFAFVLAMTALAAILLPSFSHAAQITFQRTYGDTGYNGALSVRQTTDGGFIITGHDYSVYSS